MGDDQAFILLNVGIKETIDKDAPKRLAKLQLKFKITTPNGLPAQEEFNELVAIERQLERFAKRNGDWYVGRITVAGQRRFYIYISVADHLWSNFADRSSSETGYELSTEYRDDPEHNGYWQNLFPSNDDWQVINDLKVIEAAAKHGDDGSASRQVDHWIYFEDEAAAKSFVAWAQCDRFSLLSEESRLNDDGSYCVRLTHNGSLSLGDITSHTLVLNRKAREFGGNYDGWETFIVKAQS